VGKRIVLVLVLAAVVSGAVFAQNFWISAEGSVAGGGARVELMLFEWLSVGVNAYYNFGFLPPLINSHHFTKTDMGIDFSVRLYPGAGSFFIGIGLGYHESFRYGGDHIIITSTSYGGGEFFHEREGFGITPEIGWKIDLGKQGGFFIQPGIKVPLVFAESKLSFLKNVTSYISYSYDGTEDKSAMSVDFVPYIGIGFAF